MFLTMYTKVGFKKTIMRTMFVIAGGKWLRKEVTFLEKKNQIMLVDCFSLEKENNMLELMSKLKKSAFYVAFN